MSSDHPVTIRAVTEADIDAHFHVMCEAFALEPRLARGIYDSDPFYQLSHKRILYAGSPPTPAAGLTIVPVAMRLPGGAVLPIAGIAGVGTVPAMRSQGFAGELLRATLRDAAAELGYPMAGLVTDRPDYYRRFGWETCSRVINWRAERRTLPAHASAGDVAELCAADYARHAEAVHELQDSSGRETPGTFVRDPRRWKCIETLMPGRRVAAWRPRGRVEAYAAFEIEGELGAETLDVHEMIAPTPAGKVALVGYLAAFEGVKMVTGRTNRSGLKAFGLDLVPKIELDERDGIMLRVVNIEDCLATVGQTGFYTRALSESRSGLIIRVDNASLPHHRKPIRMFTVVDDSHRVRIALAPADEVDGEWIAGPIGALSQMISGRRCPGDLHQIGHLRASGPDAIALADQLFPATDPFLALPDMI